MIPLWNKENGTVFGESGMFFGTKPVRLRFPAAKILSVKCPVRGVEYREGVDFSHTPGSDLLYRIETGAIPGMPEDGMFPDKETAILYPAEGSNAVGGGPDDKYLLFSAVEFFAQHQVEVDYQTTETTFPVFPALEPGQLPRFCSKLKPGNKLSITLIGDSISLGYNATKFLNVAPYNPTYIEQFAGELASRSGAEITVKNCAVNGSGCKQSANIEDSWLNEPCDLLVIAYGMNDFARLKPEEFGETICGIINKKRSVHPETEFILVVSMSGNPLWRWTPAGCDLPFAEVLKIFSSETVAIADVGTFWHDLLTRKDFYDLTGNGVNHPNDYGHRVYASVLTALFDSKI